MTTSPKPETIEDQTAQAVDPATLLFGPLEVPVSAMPALIVGYIALERAKYYATLDSERGDGEYRQVLAEEFSHALKRRSEIKDWMENNMDLHLADATGVEIGPNAQGLP